MAKVKVHCPECGEACIVQVEDYELEEDCVTDNFEAECDCGCEFSFGLALDTFDKKKKQ